MVHGWCVHGLTGDSRIFLDPEMHLVTSCRMTLQGKEPNQLDFHAEA